MHIDHITINLTPPSAIVQAFLAALTRVPPADAEAPEPEAAPATMADASTHAAGAVVLPRIGQPWPGLEGSAYAGLARGEDGQPDGHLVLLADKPEGALQWKAAVAWAEGLGDGARLPTRFESALLYANLQDRFSTDVWHWTGTQYSVSYAWFQYFFDGFQYTFYKSYEASARAVRRFTA